MTNWSVLDLKTKATTKQRLFKNKSTETLQRPASNQPLRRAKTPRPFPEFAVVDGRSARNHLDHRRFTSGKIQNKQSPPNPQPPCRCASKIARRLRGLRKAPLISAPKRHQGPVLGRRAISAKRRVRHASRAGALRRSTGRDLLHGGRRAAPKKAAG